jgi:hypothetical protein
MYEENNGYLILLAGKQRAGKSWGSLYLALRITGYGETWFKEDIGTPKARFDLKRHLVFTAVEFLRAINDPLLQQGDVIFWDDCGVGLSADDWFTLMNKTISAVLQPICEKNITILFTTPQSSLVIKKVRKLFHYLIECKGVNRHDNTCQAKLFEIEAAVRRDEIYYKNIWAEKGEVDVKIDGYIMGCPPPEFSTPYRARRKLWDDELNRKALKNATAIEEIEDDIDKLRRIAGEVIENKEEFIRTTRGKIKREFYDIDLIAMHYRLSDPAATKVRRLVEKATVG